MALPYHEPTDELSAESRETHRAISSLIEELEAVDWYHQRADVTTDAELKAVLLHNRDEEIEHAAMLLEWLRRRISKFDEELRTYLFTTAPIDQLEDADEASAEDGGDNESATDLGIGKLDA